MKRELLLPLLGVVAVVLLLAAGWFVDARAYMTAKEERDRFEATVKDGRRKAAEMARKHERFKKDRADVRAVRMVSDPGDAMQEETFRRFYEIEKAAGVYLISGQIKPRKAQAMRGVAQKPWSELEWTIKIVADYAGLVRYLDAIENEVSRPAEHGGGRLFEVRGIKTDDEVVEGRPGWRRFEIQMLSFTLPDAVKPPAPASPAPSARK